jgi:hypothetical protein
MPQTVHAAHEISGDITYMTSPIIADPHQSAAIEPATGIARRSAYSDLHGDVFLPLIVESPPTYILPNTVRHQCCQEDQRDPPLNAHWGRYVSGTGRPSLPSPSMGDGLGGGEGQAPVPHPHLPLPGGKGHRRRGQIMCRTLLGAGPEGAG